MLLTGSNITQRGGLRRQETEGCLLKGIRNLKTMKNIAHLWARYSWEWEQEISRCRCCNFKQSGLRESEKLALEQISEGSEEVSHTSLQGRGFQTEMILKVFEVRECLVCLIQPEKQNQKEIYIDTIIYYKEFIGLCDYGGS